MPAALPPTSTRAAVRSRVAGDVGLATSWLSRRLGRGEGSVIGGRVSLLIDPRALEKLAVGRLVALVTGTNGKTTTTSMLSTAMAADGPVVSNTAGANMFAGMVGALAASPARTAVLEVDESHLPETLVQTGARLVVLLNLSRDQLDRSHEVRMQAQCWRDALRKSSATTAIANADDPLVVWAALGAQHRLWVAAGCGWRMDAASCPACGAQIHWGEGINAAWACSSCELRRPEPHAFVASAGRHPAGGLVLLPLQLSMPGEVNQRNAAMALTAAVLMGADPARAAEAIAGLAGTGGRFSIIEIAGVRARMVLAKNPAGWAEALRLVRPDTGPIVAAINSRVQDGRDPSWLWDVPFEQLAGRFVVATGDRGRDLAVRLRYANVEHCFTTDPKEALRTARQNASADNGMHPIDVLANYSAFQDIRKLTH